MLNTLPGQIELLLVLGGRSLGKLMIYELELQGVLYLPALDWA
jgi:hypothetical protein